MPFPEIRRGRARARLSRALIPSARYLAITSGRAALWASLGLAVALAAAAPARAVDMRILVDQAAADAGVPVGLAHAVIRQESNYIPTLRGAAGEWGLGQIKCQTAREVGFAGACGRLADPATNLRFSFAYLRRALNRGGQGCAGVSLYQRGIFGRRSCSSYGRQVLARVAGAMPREPGR